MGKKLLQNKKSPTVKVEEIPNEEEED